LKAMVGAAHGGTGFIHITHYHSTAHEVLVVLSGSVGPPAVSVLSYCAGHTDNCTIKPLWLKKL
jgi:uncharacterized protein YjlB